ncbi:procathepsin L [Leptinotarsa decemlineata]|uniref:procathepsin L n=1 Tax=Leptinotarsa decemlineata TaxID=7539 RepID=UPI003D305D35
MKLTFICFTSLFLFAEGQFGGVFPKLQLSPKSYSIPNPQRIKGSLSFGVGSRDTPAAHVGVHIANPVPATLFTVPPNIPTIGVPVTQHIPIPSAVVVKIPVSSNEQKMQEEWNSFRTTFNKVYPTAEEEALRREIFFENRAKIDRLNDEYSQGRRSYVQRLNPFADLLLHEFTRAFNGYNRSTSTPRVSIPQSTAFIPSANVIFPKSVDWREVGAVTDVKYQGKCAACWAFAAAGALESHTFRKTGMLVNISAQNLIDCTEPYGNSGCSGGLMNPAFEYVRDNKGVDSEQSYPFEEKDGECRFRREFVVATCTGYVDIAENDEKGLEIAIATIGPVTAAIDAGQETFQFYSEGIYDDPACGNKPEQMNHAVLIVGYGQEPDGRKYWLIKNSYGPQWGMGGYFKMAKEAGNQCGIAIQASYPLV